MSAEQRLLAVSPNLPCAMDRQEWSLEDYHICKTLYNGYAAQVYTATCRYSGMEVVLKVYHDVDKAPDVAQHEIYREVAIQSGLQHPNVVHLFGAFEEGDTLVLVQEYVPNGDLLALMQNHGGRVDEATVVKLVLRPLLGALMYLHRWGIVHRDVKPENVLFAGDGSIKLADFGLAINMVEERPISRVGTLDYMAPEVLRCPIKQSMAMTPAPGAPARYGFATDVWAVGIVTYELLTGLPPYASECRYQAESRICSSLPPLFPHLISPLARDFILRALAPIPGDRPTVRQMLEHPWIVNPDACMTPGRAPALPHSYSYSQPPPQRSSFPPPQPAASAPLPSPIGCSSSGPQNPVASRAAVAAAPLSAASTAVSSPAGSAHSQAAQPPLVSQFSAAAAAAAAGQAGLSLPHLVPHHLHHSPQHQQHPQQHQHAFLPPQQHQQAGVEAAAAAATAAVAAAAAASVDQQLRALQQQQILDLSKLPLDQIQGMIQKLQEAMQLAVVQQQQQQHQMLPPQQQEQALRAAGSGASAVFNHNEQDAAHSCCSGGRAAAAEPAAASCNDVPMMDVPRDSASMPAPAAPIVGRSPAAAAVPSTALSCTSSPQQHRDATAAAAAVAVTQQPCRGSPHAVVAADSASFASTATGYGSLCASRRTTVDATPRTARAAPFVATAADSPTRASCVRLAPSPRELAAAAASCHSPVAAPAVVAATAVAATPRATCSGCGDGAVAVISGAGGSQGGAMHEGDGLVYVSIGSSRKAAGAALAQCDGGCRGGADGGDDVAREAFLAAWMRQFGAP